MALHKVNVVLPATDMEQCKSKLRIIGFLYKISALQFAFYNRKKINSCMGEPKFVNIYKSIKEIKYLGVVFLNKTILEVVRETSFIQRIEIFNLCISNHLINYLNWKIFCHRPC